MSDSLKKEEVVVRVELTVPGHSAPIVSILRQAARREADSALSNRLFSLADSISAATRDSSRHRRKILRPRDDDEMALLRVVKGGAPVYPVLSRPDARRAFIALSGKCSIREIARRLHVDPRTISRWSQERREGRWEG